MVGTSLPNFKTFHTPYIGVSYHKNRGKYVAYLRVDGRQMHLGVFDNAEDAARTRDLYAVLYRGERAVLNFPGDRALYESRVVEIETNKDQGEVA